MARPRQSMNRVVPGLSQETHAVTFEDMGVQMQDMSLTANSAASINTVLNSLLTSNVAWMAYPMAGYSYLVNYSESTDPTRSAVFLSLHAHGISAAVANVVVPSRVFIFQRQD